MQFADCRRVQKGYIKQPARHKKTRITRLVRRNLSCVVYTMVHKQERFQVIDR